MQPENAANTTALNSSSSSSSCCDSFSKCCVINVPISERTKQIIFGVWAFSIFVLLCICASGNTSWINYSNTTQGVSYTYSVKGETFSVITGQGTTTTVSTYAQLDTKNGNTNCASRAGWVLTALIFAILGMLGASFCYVWFEMKKPERVKIIVGSVLFWNFFWSVLAALAFNGSECFAPALNPAVTYVTQELTGNNCIVALVLLQAGLAAFYVFIKPMVENISGVTL